MKHLTRSDNKIFAGVLAGIAEYFELDASLVRLGFVILLIFTGFFPFGLFYVIAWLIIPTKKGESVIKEKHDSKKEESKEDVSRETTTLDSSDIK